MFGLFGSNTPQYQGTQQPYARQRDGLWGFVARLFGGDGAPAYGGASPMPSGGGDTVQPTPAQSDPVQQRQSPGDASAPAPSADEADEQPPPVKTVTIIVKPGPGTTVEQVVEFLRERCSIPSA